MKKLVLLFVICCFYVADTHAQCTPVDCPGAPSLFDFGGVCNDVIPTGMVGIPYVESESFRITNQCFNPADFDPTLPNLIIRLRNLRNFVFSGLPTGVTAVTNATTYTTGPTPVVGCVAVSGTPTTAGVFAAGIDVTAGIRSWLFGGCNGIGNIDIDQAFSFSLDVTILPDPSFTGLASSYTTLDAPVTLVPTGTMGGSFSGPGVSGSVFSPLMAGPGTHEIIYSVSAQQGLAVAPASNADTMTVLVTPGGCQPGFYFNPLTSLCEPCPGGTFEFEGSCSPCASGEYSDPGETSCGPCPDGQTANAQQDGCVNCNPGSYGAGGICIPCDAGEYSDQFGATNCETCPAGFVVNETQTGCDPCPADTVYLNDITCDPGLAGTTDTTYLTNQLVCDSLVIVSYLADTAAPLALCQNISVQLNGAGTATITAGMLDAGSIDSCGIAAFSASQTSFTCDDIGTNGVILTVTDIFDNEKTCQSLVTVSDPFAACCIDQQLLSLSSGWNMVSSYIDPLTPDMLELLSDIGDAVVILKDGEGKVVIPSIPLNQVGDWVVTEGYQLKTDRDTTLVVGCTQVAPELTPVNLLAGWSIVPYLRDDNLDAAAAFASLGDTLIIAKDNDGNVYLPSLPLNNIGDLIPGNGYQVKLTEPATLLYQANTIRQQGADTYTQPTPPQRLVYAGNTGNNATILLPKGSVEGVAEGDEIGLFNAFGDLVGSAVYRDGPMAITAWGNDPITDDERHLTLGEPFRFKVSRTDGTLQDLWPSYRSGPASYIVNGLTIVASARLQPRDVLTGSLELYAYPNPANTTLYFDIVAGESAEVKLTLYDLTGKVVMAPVLTRLETGHNLIDLDVSGLAAGEYFYTVRSADGLVNGKVIVVR